MPKALAECRRVLQPGGRIVVVSLSKKDPPSLALEVFQWTHQHFPNLLDCRLIYPRRALEAAGFVIDESRQARMWVPVEIVMATSS